MSTFATANAEIAQLVEHNLAPRNWKRKTTLARLDVKATLLSKANNAEIAQLVEHNLAKVGVASSSLVFRSNEKCALRMLYEIMIVAQVAEW